MKKYAFPIVSLLMILVVTGWSNKMPKKSINTPPIDTVGKKKVYLSEMQWQAIIISLKNSEVVTSKMANQTIDDIIIQYSDTTINPINKP